MSKAKIVKDILNKLKSMEFTLPLNKNEIDSHIVGYYDGVLTFNREIILNSNKIRDLKLKTKYKADPVKYDRFILDKLKDEYILNYKILNVDFSYVTNSGVTWHSEYKWVENLGEWKFIKRTKYGT